MFTLTLINGVRTWHATVPDGEVVVYEPWYSTSSRWAIYGPNARTGREHFSGADTEVEAMEIAARAVRFYSGEEPTLMGRWYRSDKVTPPADADERTAAIVMAIVDTGKLGTVR